MLSLAQIEVSVLEHDAVELLLGGWHSWWQRHHVPVDVRVAVLTAEAEDVEPFDWQDLRQSSAQMMYESLDSEVAGEVEVGDDLFSVLKGRDEEVSPLQGWLAQDCDQVVVAVHDVLAVVAGPTVDDAAEEAVALTDSRFVGLVIEGLSLVGHVLMVPHSSQAHA